MAQKIRIELKSYDYNLVDKSAEKIVKTVNKRAIVMVNNCYGEFTETKEPTDPTPAIIGGVAVYLIMTLMQYIDKKVQKKSKRLELYVELAKNFALGDFLRELRSREVEVQDIQHEYNDTTEDGVRGYIVYLKQKKRIKMFI